MELGYLSLFYKVHHKIVPNTFGDGMQLKLYISGVKPFLAVSHISTAKNWRAPKLTSHDQCTHDRGGGCKSKIFPDADITLLSFPV